MTLKKLVKEVNPILKEGTDCVAILRTGRSWWYASFQPLSGDYENGYTFSDSDVTDMEKILEDDPCAMMLIGCIEDIGADGDYTNLTDKELEERIEMNRMFSQHTMQYFLDQWVIREGTEDPEVTYEDAFFNFQESMKDNGIMALSVDHIRRFEAVYDDWKRNAGTEYDLYGDGIMDAGLIGDLVTVLVDELEAE